MVCGVAQGAILFLIKGGDFQQIIEKHGHHPNLYADDPQSYGVPGAADAHLGVHRSCG